MYKWSDRLIHLESFCASFEQESFTAAARQLGVTPQAVSRAVAKLEESLGAALFRRTTRSIRATTFGQSYYQAAREAMRLLKRAEAEVPANASEPAGSVRISVPTTYGHYFFLPRLGRFRAAHPQVEIDVHVSNRNVDFIKERFDAAIRLGRPDKGSFVAKKLGDFELGLFASPGYLRRRGTPKSIDKLEEHECAVFVMPRTGRPLPWSFRPQKQVTPAAPVRILEDVVGLVRFAAGGGGLIQTYRFMVQQMLDDGRLVEVLPRTAGRRRPFYLLYPKMSRRAPAARALIDFTLQQARSAR